MFAMYTFFFRSRSTTASISSSSFPARPTKGSPFKSSFSPGPSPISMISASRGPTPNTTLVRVSARAHFLQFRQVCSSSSQSSIDIGSTPPNYFLNCIIQTPKGTAPFFLSLYPKNFSFFRPYPSKPPTATSCAMTRSFPQNIGIPLCFQPIRRVIMEIPGKIKSNCGETSRSVCSPPLKKRLAFFPAVPYTRIQSGAKWRKIP